MPVFTKESHNHFDVDHFEVDNSFGFRITVDGDYFAFAGMSLGDLVTINQHIAEAIRKGRRSALCGLTGTQGRGAGRYRGYASRDHEGCREMDVRHRALLHGR